MAWKETIEGLPKRVDSLERMLKFLVAQAAAQSERLERIEAQLQALYRDKSQSVEQMADRLIQMSMVQRGESREASVHRRTTPGIASSLLESVGPANLWGELPDEDQWPPKNVDVVARL